MIWLKNASGPRKAQNLFYYSTSMKTKAPRDLPGSTVVKSPPANDKVTRVRALGPGRSHMPRSN